MIADKDEEIAILKKQLENFGQNLIKLEDEKREIESLVIKVS